MFDAAKSNTANLVAVDASGWGNREWCTTIASAKRVVFLGNGAGGADGAGGEVDFDTKLYIASLAAALATEIGFDGSTPLTGVVVAAPTAASGSEGGSSDSAASSPHQPVAPLPIWDSGYYAAQFQLGIARVLCTCCGGASVAIVAPSDGAMIAVARDATRIAVTLAVDVRRFSVPRDGSVCVYVNRTGGTFVPHESMEADHCFHYRQESTVYETTVTAVLPFDRTAQRIALATALTSNIYSDRIHWSPTLALTLRRVAAVGAAACGGSGSNGAAMCGATAGEEAAARAHAHPREGKGKGEFAPPDDERAVPVRFICTVTFYANLAHSLTRSP